MGRETTRAVVVTTAKGALKGYTSDDVNIFLGIPYARSKRFQMPRPVEPWTGVRACYSYGFGSPTGAHLPGDETMMPLRFWPEHENCQYLNIWTRRLGTAEKRPVLVWLHGGGYSVGSGMEHMYYDGENLCRGNDVVVVTLNHRLNILGYLDLSPFGEKYANSGNAGNADIVAALQWIHENIAAFGGDPDCVTIFGQSGGGAKVRDLLQTPAADGLYHRAIVQSGVIASLADTPPDQNGREIVTALLQDLSFDSVAQLETVPYARLSESYDRVAPEILARGGYIGGAPLPNDWYWGDSMTHPVNPYSLTVPTMIGTVFAEFSYTVAPEGKYALSEAEQMAFLRSQYADQAETVAALFRAAYPEKNLCDAAAADEFMRAPSLRYGLRRAAAGGAPVYFYLFSYETNMEQTPAWHLIEIPFVFRNAHMVPRLIEAGVTDRLEDQMANAWAAFAENGNPWHPGLPAWPSATAEDDNTMVFDRQVRLANRFDRAFQTYMTAHFPQSIITAAVGNSHEDALSEEERAQNETRLQTTLKD